MTHSDKYPAAYLYENSKGQRFCVLAMDVKRSVGDVVSLKEGFRSYAKSKQLAQALEWVGKKELPIKLSGNHPDVYLMCKEE